MATPRNQQKDAVSDEGGSSTQKVAGSELAERHQRRTGKHRAPKQLGRLPRKRQKSQPRGDGEQGELPFTSSSTLSSWMKPDIFSKRMARVGGAFIVGLMILGGLLLIYQIIAGSRFFRLRAVEVEGNKVLSQEKIDSLVRAAAPGSVLKADLTLIREKLLSNEVILEAEVSRLLPDMLRVVIKEREPYALARRGDGRVVCVDRNGSMFGDQSLLGSQPVLPIVTGLVEAGERAEEINRARLWTYQKLLSELDGQSPQLSSRIDEVIFDDITGLRVILVDSRIAVYLGREDYRVRLNAALDVLDAVRRKDVDALNVLRVSDAEKLLSGAKIEYLNSTIPKRVVVGLDQ